MKVAERLHWLVPRSIAARLALGSAILVIVALIVTGVSTGVVLSRFIRGQIDQRLDAQIGAVAAALSAQATLPERLQIIDPPPFDRANDGWYWVATANGHTYRSASLNGRDIEKWGSERWWGDWREADENRDDRPRPFDGLGPRGEHLYLRTQTVPMNGIWVTITATAPAHALVRPLRDAMMPVVLSMLLLGLLLAVASILQLRLGLRPLASVTKELERVRAGTASRIAGNQPRELRGLVSELNSLIEQNAEGIRRARGHVSNLGHALNTPLAALSLSLAASKRPEDRARVALVSEMQDRIRHHLGRARAAALHGSPHVSTPVGHRVRDIVDVLLKVYAEKRLTVTSEISNAVTVACEPQDLDEILGNVLDNAFKWAEGTVAINAFPDGNQVVLEVADDGPGITEEKMGEVLRAGRKLDESVAGHGFGLSITRELAELYGGDVRLGRSGLGGLKVAIRLPVTAGEAGK